MDEELGPLVPVSWIDLFGVHLLSVPVSLVCNVQNLIDQARAQLCVLLELSKPLVLAHFDITSKFFFNEANGLLLLSG